MNFKGANFYGKVDFEDAYFAGLCIFEDTAFCCEANFKGAIFSGQAIFRFIKDNPRDIEDYRINANFQNIIIEKSENLCFENTSIFRTTFYGTDMRLIRFRNVSWYNYKGRQIVYDEIFFKNIWKSAIWRAGILKSFRVYRGVEELYRYLKLNYEREGDFKRAGDFHYGEMEMHRLASLWHLFPFSWYNLYWCLSGYGERPVRALIWVLIFLFGITGLVWWCKLSVDDYGHWAGFLDSLIYIFQKATLQRPEWPKPVTFGSRFLSSLSVLLLPGQAALFILALRNRLGRRR